MKGLPILLALRKLPKYKSFVYCKKYKNYNIWFHFLRDQQGLCLCEGGLFLGYLPLCYLLLLRQTYYFANLCLKLQKPLREPIFKQTTLEALTSTRGNYKIPKHVKISGS